MRLTHWPNMTEHYRQASGTSTELLVNSLEIDKNVVN